LLQTSEPVERLALDSPDRHAELADGLADLMEHVSDDDDQIRRDMTDLRKSVGIEHPS
jgi:hypothetical protein